MQTEFEPTFLLLLGGKEFSVVPRIHHNTVSVILPFLGATMTYTLKRPGTVTNVRTLEASNPLRSLVVTASYLRQMIDELIIQRIAA